MRSRFGDFNIAISCSWSLDASLTFEVEDPSLVSNDVRLEGASFERSGKAWNSDLKPCEDNDIDNGRRLGESERLVLTRLDCAMGLVFDGGGEGSVACDDRKNDSSEAGIRWTTGISSETVESLAESSFVRVV